MREKEGGRGGGREGGREVREGEVREESEGGGREEGGCINILRRPTKQLPWFHSCFTSY